MIKIITAVILAVVSIGFFDQAAYATAANMYLAPALAPVTIGEKLSVELRENSGDNQVNVVRAYLVYPADKLGVTSITIAPSFNFTFKSAAENGVIEVFVGTNQPVSSDQLVATIIFEALKESGSAAVNIDADKSYIVGPGDKEVAPLTNTGGGTYTLVEKKAAAQATPVMPTPTPPATSITPAQKPPPPPTAVASENKISVALATPNTRRAKEPTYVSFWIPIVILVVSLLVSILRAKGYKVHSVSRHFTFLSSGRTKKYHAS